MGLPNQHFPRGLRDCRGLRSSTLTAPRLSEVGGSASSGGPLVGMYRMEVVWTARRRKAASFMMKTLRSSKQRRSADGCGRSTGLLWSRPRKVFKRVVCKPDLQIVFKEARSIYTKAR